MQNTSVDGANSGNTRRRAPLAARETARQADPTYYEVKDDGRMCTDVFFLLLFILFWGGMAAIAAVGVQKGDPAKLIYATDLNVSYT